MRIPLRLFATLTPLVALLVLWNVAVPPSSRYAFLIGRPEEILSAASRLLWTKSFWADFSASLVVLLQGFVIGAIGGFLLGLLIWQAGRTGRIVERYLIALGAIPLFAVAPLLIFVMGIGPSTRVFIVTISVLVPMAQASLSAAKDAERHFADLLRSFGSTRWHRLRLVIGPGAFFASLPVLKPCANAALVAVFLSEWISAQNGLAKFVLASMSVYAVPDMWVGLLAFVFLGVLFGGLVDLLETRVTRWRRS